MRTTMTTMMFVLFSTLRLESKLILPEYRCQVSSSSSGDQQKDQERRQKT
jgi:hypothetical protein